MDLNLHRWQRCRDPKYLPQLERFSSFLSNLEDIFLSFLNTLFDLQLLHHGIVAYLVDWSVLCARCPTPQADSNGKFVVGQQLMAIEDVRMRISFKDL